MKASRLDRIAGCLLGGALGDAIGSQFEGRPPTASFSLPHALSVTDDTQLTLATCEAIIATGSVNPASIAERFVAWFRARRLVGVGSSTLKALTELAAGGHWALVGATGERAAGNGAAMRIAPLAFFLDPDIDSHRQAIRDVARITHRHDEAYLGAIALLRAIRHVGEGGCLEPTLWTRLIAALPDSQVRDRLIVLSKDSLTIERYAEQFPASGYVVDSVPLAILAAIQSTNAIQTIEQLIRCGGDTDTIASMFGQLFGAAHGVGVWPSEMLERIDDVVLVRELANNLARISVVVPA